MIFVLGKSALSVPDTRFSRVSGSTLVMGIIEQARFNLSVGRRMRYLELLEKHNLTVRIIKTKNEANRLLFCDEGEPHCCEDEGIKGMKIRPDLK